MTSPFLCVQCDCERETETAKCPDCEEVTGSYTLSVEPDDGQILHVRGSGSYIGVFLPAIGFEREAHTGLISLGEDRRAA